MFKQLPPECDALGISIEAVTTGKHNKIRLRNAHGVSTLLVTAVSPSDHRAWLNCRAFLRRFARTTTQEQAR